MLAGIDEILIISTPIDIDNFKRLFEDGKKLGLRVSYSIQDQPKGISEALIIGKEFIGNDSVCLILGDNIFYGDGFTKLLKDSIVRVQENLATIFAYRVKDPKRFGVVEILENSFANNIEEKPKNPKSNFAVTGIYFYPNDVLRLVEKIEPSSRGELEITDLNKIYINQNRLYVEKLFRGFTWIDTGTHDSMLEASNLISTIQKRNGMKIGCIEEIAFYNKFISDKELLEICKSYRNNEYGKYLKDIVLGKL
jgi:glucose-1-phosphate thymidylyltransferase